MVAPLRLFVGRQNIRQMAGSSADEMGRALAQDLREFVGDLREYIENVKNVSPDILVEALEPTFGKALDWCPVETGALRESGYLEVEKYRNGAQAVMGFGRGGNPDYTVFVHEVPAKHAPPTRTKWFQEALDDDYNELQTRIYRLTRFALGLGGA